MQLSASVPTEDPLMKLIVFAWTLLAALPILAQTTPVITPPMTYAWIASSCDTWNCASSALVMADGDPFVFALPTNSAKYPWVVVRRVIAGSVWLPPDNPFDVEKFDDMDIAVSRYAAIGSDHSPILVTSIAGTPLVVSLKQPSDQRVRSVRR